MFYCDPCRIDRNWPESFFQSRGPCEICGTYDYCHEVASSKLPLLPRVPTEAEVITDKPS